MPLFPAPGAPGDPQGVLRIVNDTAEAATVRIFAIADAGTRSGPATIALGASAAVEFDATELRSANPAKGLSGGLGSFSGDVRLTIDSDAPIVPLAFVRASDGTLSAMHDSVRAGSAAQGAYRYDVPIFNLSTAVSQDSRLRLINAGDTSAAVTIEGNDDGDAATGGTVGLTLPAGGARTLTAQQLEAGGAGLTGQLGAGIGRWRLTVSSDQPLHVVNVAASPAGYWSNLSTTAARGAAPANLAGFNDRFVGEGVVLETGVGRSSLMPAENGRFSDTQSADGTAATFEGDYNYAGLGPDAGRLTLDYDDGTRCESNVYFSSRTSGWFAERCTGGPDLEDTWSGGNWSADTYYYGACVDSVENEWTTHNNCSSAVRVTVGGSDGGGDGDPAGACKAELIVNPGESCAYKGSDFRVDSSGRGSIQPAAYYFPRAVRSMHGDPRSIGCDGTFMPPGTAAATVGLFKSRTELSTSTEHCSLREIAMSRATIPSRRHGLRGRARFTLQSKHVSLCGVLVAAAWMCSASSEELSLDDQLLTVTHSGDVAQVRGLVEAGADVNAESAVAGMNRAGNSGDRFS